MPITLTFGFSSAIARITPIMVAPPAMSYFIFSMPSAGLIEMPPVSKVIPFPTKPKNRLLGRTRRFVAHHDQCGRLVRSWATLQNAPIFNSLILSPP